MKSRKVHEKKVQEVMEELLGKLENKFYLGTPKSVCCKAPTYVTVEGQVCAKCGRVIQTTL